MSESFLSRYRWPIGIIGIICCFFVADGILIYTAVRDYDRIAPESDYYDRAVNYDQSRQSDLRAQEAGLKAEISVASAPIADMPRRVDIRVLDRAGQPVSGLSGKLKAVRPSDARLTNEGSLIAVPGHEGLYRLLLAVPISGLWEFELTARKGSDDYRMVVRQDVQI